MTTARELPYSLRFLLKNKALNYPLFRNYLLTRGSLIMALNMQTAIIVYWVYQVTGDVATVGLLGLFEAIPAIGFSLFSGHFVDQREKRGIIFFCLFLYIILAAAFIVLALPSTHSALGTKGLVWCIYGGIFLGGALRAFVSPASFAMMGLLLPRRLYPNGATWSSTSWQLGAVLGPLLGGFLLGWTNVPVALSGALILMSVAFFAVMKIPAQAVLKKTKEPILQSLRGGLQFVFNTQLVLAALSLDMFAVLFGGAIALLPAYAKDILHVGEHGYGMLRAAPGMGAIIMFFVLSAKPLKTNPGLKLLGAISGFGICTIIFGLSKVFVISFIALVLTGAFDAVSVVIRSTILQLYTPDAMRGRVAAVNTMFISSSNELGEVESGFTAKWMGTVPSVVFGGCMTLAIVAITSIAAPKIRKLQLDAKLPKNEN